MFDETVLFTYIGYAAGLATILTFTIQILKIIETKNVISLSSYMYTIYSLGLICWAVYGIYIENLTIVLANLITFFFTFSILILIIYYDAEDKIERQRRDTITNAFNRKYFEQTIPVKITETQVMNQNCAIMLINITNLKKLIKECGSKNTNKALKAITKNLEKNLRASDIIARIDDSKFAVYLDDVDSISAENVAKRLYKNVTSEKIKITKDNDINIDIKMGICTTEHGNDMEELLQKAEKMLKSITVKNPIKIKICDK